MKTDKCEFPAEYAGHFLQDNLVCCSYELSDSLAVAAVHMAGLTAGKHIIRTPTLAAAANVTTSASSFCNATAGGGQVVFSLRSSLGVDFEFKIVYAELRWKQVGGARQSRVACWDDTGQGTCLSMQLTSTSRLQDAL